MGVRRVGNKGASVTKGIGPRWGGGGVAVDSRMALVLTHLLVREHQGRHYGQCFGERAGYATNLLCNPEQVPFSLRVSSPISTVRIVD